MARRWPWGGPAGAHRRGPASVQPPPFVWEDPCSWLGGCRAGAGPAQVTPEGGAGHRLVAGSRGGHLSWGRCGLSVPRAGLATPPPPQQQEGRDCTLTCPQKTGPVSPVLPLEVHWSGRASTPMDLGTGHLLGSRYQERWGQGRVPGAPRRLEAPAASGQQSPARRFREDGGPGAAGHRAGPRPTSQLPAQSCGCHPRSGGLQTSRELCARGREAPEGRRAVRGALGPQP